ncbi:hypothetical protein Tco_0234383, partial [Tanacetum coccineum]
MNSQVQSWYPKVVPPADKKATSRQELELLFHHHIAMLRKISKKNLLDMSLGNDNIY